MSATSIFILGFVLGVLLDFVFGFVLNSLHIKTVIFGFRTHHSVLGIILIIVGIFVYPLYLISLGIGIIFGHTLRNKEFEFIKKKS